MDDQNANKTYNIGVVHNATFVYPDGQNVFFNDYLIKILIPAIKPYSKASRVLLDKKIQIKDRENWNNIEDHCRTARQILINNFGGILGSKIQDIFAIGTTKPLNEINYINTCLSTAENAMKILCFTLISDLWNKKENDKDKDYSLSSDQEVALRNFFGDSTENQLSSHLNLFKNLYELYTNKGLKFPINALTELANEFRTESPLYEACEELNKIREAKNTDKYSIKTCGEVEKQLTHLLGILGFLAGYRMVSIKGIDYEKIRNAPERYLHNVIPLGPAETNSTTTQLYVDKPVDTDCVLLYLVDEGYLNGINLFPFVIDINALNIETVTGTKICFFSYVGEDEEVNLEDELIASNNLSANTSTDAELKYIYFRFLQNDQTERIPIPNNPDLKTEEAHDTETRKKAKLESVALHFLAAKKTILG